MRDFFAHITQSRDSQCVTMALEYFNDLFPDSDNRIISFEGLNISISNDLSTEKILSPLWCKIKGAYLFVFGEYSLPDCLKVSKNSKTDDPEDIANLFDIHGDALFEKVSGNFNALIYYPGKTKFVAITSKLGLYPVYYQQLGKDFMVSSRLGAFKKISGAGKLNFPVIMQHCLYNYPISNKTFIQEVHVQPAGSILVFNNYAISINKYWTIDQEMVDSQGIKSLSDSIDLMDTVLDRLIRRQCYQTTKVGLSFTGGWDGRLLLSYALKYLSHDQMLLYSHGTMQSPDIKIPLSTSDKLNFNYIPVLLDDPEYLSHQLKWAADTVKYSDGIRQITRLHYLYTMSLLRNSYGVRNIISGNGGSNLLKSSNYRPCSVFNRFVIELIESDNIESTLRKHYEYCQFNLSTFFQNVDWNSFLDSFDQKYLKSLLLINNKGMRFLHLLVSEIERKYFGSEIQSYKHVVKNYSPFFDDEFIKALMQTTFICFDDIKGIQKSHKLSLLYGRLITKNNKDLAKEQTDRGFSMNDVSNPLLFPQMLYKYFKNKLKWGKATDFFCNKNIPNLYAQKYLEKSALINSKYSSDQSFVENYISVMSFLNE